MPVVSSHTPGMGEQDSQVRCMGEEEGHDPQVGTNILASFG